MFDNTTPDVSALGLRAVINDQIARNVWHSGQYDNDVSLANHRALTRGPFLSTVIMPKGDTFVLRPVVKSSETYGSIGDLIAMLHGLDGYPLIDDEIHSDLVYEETLSYLERSYSDIEDTGGLLTFMHENNAEICLESGMSIYIENEDELVSEFRTLHKLDA